MYAFDLHARFDVCRVALKCFNPQRGAVKHFLGDFYAVGAADARGYDIAACVYRRNPVAGVALTCRFRLRLRRQQ